MAHTAYKSAGVDIEAGKQVVEGIKPLVRATFRPEVLSGLGGFAGLFSLPPKKYKNPVLVSGTDGVGTKLKIAFMTGKHDSIGIDLVAMCVNDVLVTGAEPLFFLDYFATGKLDPAIAVDVVRGIAEGCQLSGCALIGGETAEMPSSYPDGEYDLAGFSVGVVDKNKMIDLQRLRPGDCLIGLASSGLHSNAYSLARKIFFEQEGLNVDSRVTGLDGSLGEVLLTPTRIYHRAIQRLVKRGFMKAAAHITGGGLTENLPRIFPKGLGAELRLSAWPVLPVFDVLREKGKLSDEEMMGTFNMGLGMIVVVAKEDVKASLAALKRLGEKAYLVGALTEGEGGLRFV